MLTLLHKFISVCLDHVLPIACVGCSRECGSYVCGRCLAGCTPQPHVQLLTVGTRKLPVLSMHSFHTPLIRQLIHLYKYECVIQARVTMLNLVQKMYTSLPAYLQKTFMDKPVLIPTPLHIRRLKWRGFNQSETIAEGIAAINHAPIKKLLYRIRKTKTQVGNSEEERHKNLRQAFGINHSEARTIRPQQTLVLIDDVITTGSTLQEAAVMLIKRFPYSRLCALTLAHTPLSKSGKSDILI